MSRLGPSASRRRRSLEGAPPTQWDEIVRLQFGSDHEAYERFDPDVDVLPLTKALMDDLDNLSPGMRALVHEFGANIVVAMLEEGYTNADDLRGVLEERHRRRQEELLSTNHHFTWDKRRVR